MGKSKIVSWELMMSESKKTERIHYRDPSGKPRSPRISPEEKERIYSHAKLLGVSVSELATMIHLKNQELRENSGLKLSSDAMSHAAGDGPLTLELLKLIVKPSRAQLCVATLLSVLKSDLTSHFPPEALFVYFKHQLLKAADEEDSLSDEEWERSREVMEALLKTQSDKGED
jgi:transposase-like protein